MRGLRIYIGESEMSNGRERYEKRSENGRKSSNDARELEKPAQRRRRTIARGTGEVADWATVNGDTLAKAVATVAARGCAIRFGYTRDGGSYAIGILGDGDAYTEYVRPNESLDAYLLTIIEDFST